MPKFEMLPVILDGDVVMARLGSANGAANYFDDKEVGKIVKMAGVSRYNLAAVGESIEGFVSSVEVASMDDFSVGGVQKGGRVSVMADGLQATPATGVIAVNDYVVCGTVTAKGTVLPGLVKVCKATNQPGAATAVLADAVDQLRVSNFKWRVVGLGPAGTGAIGTMIVIQKI